MDTLGGGDRRRSGQGIRYEVSERDLFEVQIEDAGLGPAELEEVVDEAGETVGFVPQGRVVARNGLGIVYDAVLERLDDRANASQGRAQVV